MRIQNRWLVEVENNFQSPPPFAPKIQSTTRRSTTANNAMEAFIECMEQVGNTPYDVNLYPKYIKLAGEQDKASSNADDEAEEQEQLGPLGAEACSTMVSAMAATSGRCS